MKENILFAFQRSKPIFPPFVLYYAWDIHRTVEWNEREREYEEGRKTLRREEEPHNILE